MIALIRKISISTCSLLLICGITVLAFSQNLNAENIASAMHSEKESLSSMIAELETKYRVRLNFNSKLIEGKTVDQQTKKIKGKNIEAELSSILAPHNLLYEKIDKDHYVIISKPEAPKKPSGKKEITPSPEEKEKGIRQNNSFIRFFRKGTDFVSKKEITVTGKVVSSEDDMEIPGVNVVIKGTTEGTTTDMDGMYSLTVPENATLIFSFVGFTSQEIPVNNRSEINVTLFPDISELSEVVVIGYGTQQKRDATGAVSSVKSEDFNLGVIASPEQLIQGKAAGVQITTASGEPGAGVNIRIRGTSSVRGGNNPLFVIDGVPLAGDDIAAGGADLGRGSSAAKNPLNFLNPNDIESIDILKDASATAIYGSRGANGVVLITTKSGQGRKNVVEYSANVSIGQMANRFDLLNRDQFLAGSEALGINVIDYEGDTDWQDEISRTAISHRHDVSYANNFNTGNYRVSLSYDNQEGIIKNSGMERITARLNFNKSFFNEKLKFGTQITLSRINDEAAPITDNAGFEGDLLGATYMASPLWPNDPFQQLSNTNVNPLSFLEFTENKTQTDRALINAFLEYEILDGLNFKVNTGFDRSDSERTEVYSSEFNLSNGVFGNGRGAIAEIETSSNLMEAFFNYQKEFGDSNLSAVLGYSYQQFNRKGFTSLGWGFRDGNLNNMVTDLRNSSSTIRGTIDQSFQQFGYDQERFYINRLFPEPETVNLAQRPSSLVNSVAGQSFDVVDELQSFFGRVNYNLQDKYLFTATMRIDGSTRFGGNNKYGFFPSAAFAWRLSDEDFIPDFFDDFKLRLGWGVTGNQEIPHNLHQQRQRYRDVSIQNDGNIPPPGINNVSFNNPDLKWEETSQLNGGIDFAFRGGKVSGYLDVYRKVTTNLLIQQFSAQPAPTDFRWINLDANVINSGVELTMNYFPLETDNASLNFGFNVAYNHNIVRDFSDILNTGAISGQGLTGAFAQQIANDQPLYAFFLRDFAGYDANGIAVYEEGDFQKFLGKSPIPLYNLGFTANYRYKRFDITAFLNGQFGHYIYNNTANAFFTKGSLGSGRNVTTDVLASPESPVNAPDVSTRFLERGDFLRLQNLNLGYNFNVDGWYVSNLRVFVSGQNLFVITPYTGLDPEVNTNKAISGVPSLGIDYTAYPRPRIYTLGLNATF